MSAWVKGGPIGWVDEKMGRGSEGWGGEGWGMRGAREERGLRGERRGRRREGGIVI